MVSSEKPLVLSKTFWLVVLQVLVICCSGVQEAQIFLNCGAPFRRNLIYDYVAEQSFVFTCLYCTCLMAWIGLCRKKGATYFVFIALILTTLCVMHWVDILMATVFFSSMTEKNIQAHLMGMYKVYGDIFSYKKLRVNRLHSCLKCCGVKGPHGEEVLYLHGPDHFAVWDMTIIPSCCPNNRNDCTSSVAYQKGCVSAILSETVNDHLLYVRFGILNGILQIITSRVVLYGFVV